MIFLALIYMAFISLGLPDSVLGASWPLIHSQLRVPVGSAGVLSMITSIGTIISSLLSNLLIRRFGTGRVTVVSVGMTAIALGGYAVAPSFLWLMLCAVPLGLGAGAVDSGLNAFVARHYEARHMNWLHCCWGVGAMLGPLIISLLTSSGYSWRSGYVTISLMQFSLVAMLLFSLPMWRRYERPGAGAEDVTGHEEGSIRERFTSPLRGKGAPFALLAFFFLTSLEASLMLWGASYLVSAKGLSPEIAAGWISLFFLGITGGRVLSGFASMKWSNQALIRVGTVLSMVGLLMMLLPSPTPVALLAMLLVGMGLAPIFPSLLHETPVHFGEKDAQMAMGWQMASAYTGTTLIPPLIGLILARVSFSLMPYLLLIFGVGVLICVRRLSSMQRAA